MWQEFRTFIARGNVFDLAVGVIIGAAFGKIGLTADCGLAWSLPQRVGRTLARDLMFTGRAVRAQEAFRIGIADALAPTGSAIEAALAKAAEYRALAPLAISVVLIPRVELCQCIGEEFNDMRVAITR